MIKKLLLFAIVMLTLKAYSFGQACTPDPTYTATAQCNNNKGLHPDTITNLAEACVGVNYNATITLVMPSDTSGLTWNYTEATAYTFNPPLNSTYTVSCFNQGGTWASTDCKWKGCTVGCAIISIPNPLASDIGTHSLTVSTTTNVSLIGNTNFNLTGYKLVVTNTNCGNAVNNQETIQDLIQNNPNPFKDKTEIKFTSLKPGIATLRVFNIVGQEIFTSSVNMKQGSNAFELNAKDFDSGVYFYSLYFQGNVLTKKMMVSK